HDYNFQFFNEFYYSFLLREVVAFDVPGDESLLLRRLHHEVTHDFFERTCGMPPVWFNEGAAEVFEAARLDARGTLVLERNPEWDPRLQEELKEGGLPSLRELLAASPERFYGEDAPRVYAAAWSFMDLLLRNKGEAGEKLVRRIFTAVRERRAVSVPQIVETSLPDLESEWHERVRRDVRR
ncbi:hypothetical protein HY251_01010, partial [bacterium]|nr:hypothetical protein [bacterium]